MNEKAEITTTRHKALELNLDPLIYGSIAEIGAGQEVARNFFQAGGASGTVAKTMSAYDMNFSDAIYGQDESGRYVTRSRLESMLDKEFSLVVKRVVGVRPPDSRFFAFADTVTAKSFKQKKECHGWMGIRFQHEPGAEHSQIAIHVRMHDDSNQGQQDALGILGVNLIYAAFFYACDYDKLVDSLKDNLVWSRVEVDLIDFAGPCFKGIDHKKMNLRLVSSSLGPVVMFTPDGKTSLPSDLIYGKDVLIMRGTFRPFTNVNIDMIECGIKAFTSDLGTTRDRVAFLCEMNIARYLSEGLDEVSDLEERVETIAELGYNVMVTSHFRYFRLSEYFSKHAKRRIGFIMSVDNVYSVFNDKYYKGMEGGILDAMGRLFSSDSKLLVYPNLTTDGNVATIDNLEIPDRLKYLYRHLLYNRRIIGIEQAPDKLVPFDRESSK